MSSLVFMCAPVKSKMGAYGVYRIHECRQTSPGCSESALKNVGSAAPAWSALELHSVPHNLELAYIKLSLILKATFCTKNHSINSMLKSSVISN